MRRFFFALWFVVVLSFCTVALASDVTDQSQQQDDLTNTEDLPQDGLQEFPSDPVQIDPVDTSWELEGIEVYAIPPVTSSTGLKGVLYQVIGPYDTIVTQYTYKQNGNSYYSYVNDISPDYPWIVSAALFIVLIFCTFRVLGGLLSWRK